MLHRTLVLIFFATSLVAVEPEKLTKLRGSYELAMTKATAPIQKTYVSELEKLKIEFTKAGKLEDALAVAEELKTLAPPATATAATSTPKTNKLSKKERDAIDAAFQGKWTWKDGGIAVANQTIYKGNDRWSYEIKTDGSIQVFEQLGSKPKVALLKLQPDHQAYTATDETGASWEGKRQ